MLGLDIFHFEGLLFPQRKSVFLSGLVIGDEGYLTDLRPLQDISPARLGT